MNAKKETVVAKAVAEKEVEIMKEVTEAKTVVEAVTSDKKTEAIERLETTLRIYPRTLTIAELIGYRKHIETWLKAQRTPSHTDPIAMRIIESALAGAPCGTITLGHNTENDTISTIDGSSRIDDFIRYAENRLGKKDNKFSDLPADQQRAFLSTTLDIVWRQGTEKELIRDFRNQNSNVPLTGGQKATTHLVGSEAMDIIARIAGHSIFETFLSERQIQKQENNAIAVLILSNIVGCYNAKADKITEALASADLTDLDTDKITYILDRIEAADVSLGKYSLVHMAHIMYMGDCWKSKNLHRSFDIDELDDTAISVGVSVPFATSGTNSAEANDERIAKVAKKLYIHLLGTPEKPSANVEALDPATL